jgi:hypothetical protein
MKRIPVVKFFSFISIWMVCFQFQLFASNQNANFYSIRSAQMDIQTKKGEIELYFEIWQNTELKNSLLNPSSRLIAADQSEARYIYNDFLGKYSEHMSSFPMPEGNYRMSQFDEIPNFLRVFADSPDASHNLLFQYDKNSVNDRFALIFDYQRQKLSWPSVTRLEIRETQNRQQPFYSFSGEKNWKNYQFLGCRLSRKHIDASGLVKEESLKLLQDENNSNAFHSLIYSVDPYRKGIVMVGLRNEKQINSISLQVGYTSWNEVCPHVTTNLQIDLSKLLKSSIGTDHFKLKWKLRFIAKSQKNIRQKSSNHPKLQTPDLHSESFFDRIDIFMKVLNPINEAELKSYTQTLKINL